MKKRLPLPILQKLAEQVKRHYVLTFGRKGVARPVAVQYGKNLVEIIPKTGKPPMTIHLERLRSIFKLCYSVSIGIEGDKKVVEAKGNYEGYTATIRIHYLP